MDPEKNKLNEDMFEEINSFDDDEEEEEYDFQEEFPSGGGSDEIDPIDDPEEEEEGEEEEEEEQEGNELNFEEEEEGEEEEEELTDKDLALFNKKLNTDFKSTEDLKKYLEKDSPENNSKDDEEILKEAEATIALYEGYVEMNDEDLMRSRLEAIAVSQNKDINDDDVSFEIEEELQSMVDSKTISLHAKNLRDSLKNNYIDKAKSEKEAVQTRVKEREIAAETKSKEDIQNALADIHKAKSFYGLEPGQKTLKEAYAEIRDGSFLDKIKNDPKMQAELAVMYKMKDELSKKASGLSYSDGMAAVLDEFKNKTDKSGLSNARKSGTRGSNKNLGEDLLADILYTAPKKGKK